MHIVYWYEKQKERECLKVINVDEKIILK